jgi:hypothetical protein
VIWAVKGSDGGGGRLRMRLRKVCGRRLRLGLMLEKVLRLRLMVDSGEGRLRLGWK